MREPKCTIQLLFQTFNGTLYYFIYYVYYYINLSIETLIHIILNYRPIMFLSYHKYRQHVVIHPQFANKNENNVLKSDAEQIVEDNDIGYYLGKNVSDEIKFKLLTNHWAPDENYKFPITKNLKKKCKFQFGWTKRFL